MLPTNPKSALRDQERRIAMRRARLALAPIYEHRKQYYDVISEHSHLYSALLSVSGLRQRYQLGDPVSSLNEATQLARNLASLWAEGNCLADSKCPDEKKYTSDGKLWEQIPKTVDAIAFRFAAAGVLQLLTCEQIPSEFSGALPVIGAWGALPACPLNFPDVGLIYVLEKHVRPPWWHDMFQTLQEYYDGRSLLADTFDCYANMIIHSHREAWGRSIDEVRKAHELYIGRGDQAYDVCEPWEFEPWEGRGAFNSLVIDFRLSALMRYCFRKNQGALDSIQSPHRWPELSQD
ncbi:MAG: hypothetical protein AB7K24_34405 [Gemmataceae bacterium]